MLLTVLLVLGIGGLVICGVLLQRKELGHSGVFGTGGLVALLMAMWLLTPAETGSPIKWSKWVKECEVYRCEATVSTNVVVLSTLKGSLGLVQSPDTLSVGKWYQAVKGMDGKLALETFPPLPTSTPPSPQPPVSTNILQ